MSAYAEYKYAKTDEEREDALRGIRFESERDFYFDEYSEEYDEDED